MAFDLKKFFEELEQHYVEQDLEKTESFFKEQREKAHESRNWILQETGCSNCVPELEPNMDYIAVCNETASFYRNLSRWEESLENFSLAQMELESLYRDHTAEYAEILLNKAEIYRCMGNLKEALDILRQADRIYAMLDRTEPEVLAGLYHNIGLVYLEQKKHREASDYFKQAIEKLEQCENCEAERRTIWKNLAAAYDLGGNVEDAGRALEKAAELREDARAFKET